MQRHLDVTEPTIRWRILKATDSQGKPREQSTVTEPTIRWRILKEQRAPTPQPKTDSYRAHDPMEDTERVEPAQVAVTVAPGYRAHDPMEDTEREACHALTVAPRIVTEPTIRWRILKAGNGHAGKAQAIRYRAHDPMEDTERVGFLS